MVAGIDKPKNLSNRQKTLGNIAFDPHPVKPPKPALKIKCVKIDKSD
jgi:hypothetical protein